MNDDSIPGGAGFADPTHTSVPVATPFPQDAFRASADESAPQGALASRHSELELNAILHASSERVRYITGASGVALALCENEADEMVCRAGSGPTAPEVGTRMHIQSGITAESIRTRQTLRCDQASSDPRVNQETCRALGLESVMVMPLIVSGGVVGNLELFGHKPSAFGERDAKTLYGAAEGVQLALERAVSAGFTLGHIPWAIEVERPIEKPVETSTQPVETGQLGNAGLAQDAAAGITLRTPVVFPLADFPEAQDTLDESTSPDHEEPVPAFLARLADEAKPATGKRWSQWFRPQW